MKKITIKIGSLFEKLNITKIDELESIKGIFIKTPTGDLTEIRGLIKKSPKKIYEYSFSSGITVKCSDEHLFQENGITTKAKDCKTVDTINGNIEINNSEYIGTDFVYDLSIDNPHLYVTPNGIIHHNTSIVHAIVKELNADVKWINGSQDRGIDTFKVQVKDFITSVSIDDSPKIVVIDECLEENEKIKTPDGTMALKDMEIGRTYDCLSVNKKTLEVEVDSCEIISDKDTEVYEIEFEDGRVISVTADHPLIVRTPNGIVKKSINDGLDENDEILDYNELEHSLNPEDYQDINVKITKSQAEILKKSNINLEHLLRGFLDVVIEDAAKKDNK